MQKLAITDPFNSTDSQTCNDGYDDVARLASANCGSLFNQTFAPGALANLSQSGTLTFQPSYNAATNQITSVGGQNYRYDTDGNLQSTGTGVGTNTYTWNAYDGMAGDTPYGSNQIVITHDGLGRITLEQNGSTYTSFVYAPSGEKLAVMNGQTLNKARIGLPGGGLAIYDPTGLIRYWRTDWQGSVRLTSNPDGTYYGSGAYAPYGQTYAQSPGGPDSPFAGLIYDTSGELDDALFREYNPTQGRWMSPDPAGLSAVDLTNPQSLNRYAYVGNNPLSLIDPTGMGPCDQPGENPDADCYTVYGSGTGSGSSLSWLTWLPCYLGFGGCYGTSGTGQSIYSAPPTSTNGGSSGGGGGGGSSAPPAKASSGFTVGIRMPNQTFSQCMQQNANTYSLGGAPALFYNTVSGQNTSISSAPLVQFFTGNAISGVLYGSVSDVGSTAATEAPSGISYFMGAPLTYGRRTTDIMSLNLEGVPGGPPQALSQASRGVQDFLGEIGDVFSLGMSFTTRLGVDTALTGAEAIGCSISQ